MKEYRDIGRVRVIDSGLGDEGIYEKIQEVVKPNLIFLYGPPALGKNEVAKILAEKIRYKYISLRDFYQINNCVNDEVE